jgi:hypothetical protein
LKLARELFVSLKITQNSLKLTITYDGVPPDLSDIQNEIKILNYLSKILDGEIRFEQIHQRPAILILFKNIDFLS